MFRLSLRCTRQHVPPRLAHNGMVRLHSTDHHIIDLSYEHTAAPPGSPTSKRSLVLCHGLFGSKQNWRSLAKAFAKELHMPVYAVDLRNHGSSPHHPQLSYMAMAADLRHFCEKHKLGDVSLVGHSMGGKAAMVFALHPELANAKHFKLENLIIEDIAPTRGPLSAEFRSYVHAMRHIQTQKLTSRKEADAMLAETEPDVGIRQFLLTNLLSDGAGQPLYFRVALDHILSSVNHLGDFPFEPGAGVSWTGRALFIRGTKSHYIGNRGATLAKELFPNMKMVDFPTGHWVHAELSRPFVKEVSAFISDQNYDPKNRVIADT